MEQGNRRTWGTREQRSLNVKLSEVQLVLLLVTFHTDCLNSFCERQFYALTHVKITRHWKFTQGRLVTLRFQKRLRWRSVRCYEPFTMLTLYHLPIVVSVSKANWRPSMKSQVGPLLSASQDNFVKLSKSDGVILYLFFISLFRSSRSSCFLFDSLSALGRSTAENIRAPVTAANINAITHDKVFFCKEFMSDNECQCKEDV